MSQEETQPTPISTEEYQAFKEFVRDVHGKTRGHLGSEIENALREYRESYYGGDRLQRIENDLATIKATIADAESDGGTSTASLSEPDNARPREMSKPAANQPRAKKVQYLVNQYLRQEDCNNEGGKLVYGKVETLVQDEYSFDDEILERYVDAVYDQIKNKFDAKPHPLGNFDVWGDELEKARQEAKERTDNEFDEIAD
jgi:hypothetical protein